MNKYDETFDPPALCMAVTIANTLNRRKRNTLYALLDPVLISLPYLKNRSACLIYMREIKYSLKQQFATQTTPLAEA